jgi:hypothetical protein
MSCVIFFGLNPREAEAERSAGDSLPASMPNMSIAGD